MADSLEKNAQADAVEMGEAGTARLKPILSKCGSTFGNASLPQADMLLQLQDLQASAKIALAI